MSYLSHAAIASNGSIRQRCTAAAAQEGVTTPVNWVNSVIWNLVKSDWIAAWDSAEAGDPGGDHGSNSAVVTDGMILASVQAAVTGP